jgi:hypothetical protein
MLRSLIPAVAAVFLLLGTGTAQAFSFPLNVEFDDGLVGTYGNVEVTEVGGDLLFQITLDPSLGPDADLHVLYFNLVGSPSGLAISSTDVVNTAYELLVSPSVAGGAGSSFEYGVHFGNGAGPKGNGVLQSASFLLSADGPLAVADLLQSSSTSQKIEVYLATHVQGTALVKGSKSETVGSLVPEPAASALLGLGMAGLLVAGRRRR